jgi:PilZ domain
VDISNVAASVTKKESAVIDSRKGKTMAGGGERRKNTRVGFERGIEVYLMAIDGTWRRDCTMQEVSESGARLTVRGSIDGLNLKEFFLLLSSTGLAYRRCELSWVNGDLIGAKFVMPSKKDQGARG